MNEVVTNEDQTQDKQLNEVSRNQPVVGSTKSLIRSIKACKDKPTSKECLEKEVRTTSLRREGALEINIAKILAKPPLPDLTVKPTDQVQRQISSEEIQDWDGDDIGDGIQVEVNSSDDEYGDEPGEIPETENSSDEESEFESDNKPNQSQNLNISQGEVQNDLEDLQKDPRVQMLIQRDIIAERSENEWSKEDNGKTGRKRKFKQSVPTTVANKNNNKTMLPSMKSPSDTTLYRPALIKNNNTTDGLMNNPIEQISNFVERVRRQSVVATESPMPSTSKRKADQQSQSRQDESNKLIVQAEQF